MNGSARLNFQMHTVPPVPLEAESMSPNRLAGLGKAEICALPVYLGNQKAAIGDFFNVTGQSGLQLRIQGDLGRVKHIGAGMSDGTILIDGNSGAHLGAGMSGGEIVVEGDAGDWVGPEMTGGRIVIKGNAGHMVGSAYRGSSVGIRGGEIIVLGNVGNEAGNTMRRGLIAVGGDSGDFTGVSMLAGSIIVLGTLGLRSGAGMKRGSIVAMRESELLPTFDYACSYNPVFLRHYLLHLRTFGMQIDDARLYGRYRRWSGDSIELNRGEILIFNG